MKIELFPVGNVKIVIFNFSKHIATHPEEGKIIRCYIECDDFRNDFRKDKSYKKELSIPTITNPGLDMNKSLKLPMWIGTFAELTQADKVKGQEETEETWPDEIKKNEDEKHSIQTL